MQLESVKLAFFSPTGNTRAIVQGLARGLSPGAVEIIDLTRPAARAQPLHTSEHELLVVAVPVYMGRVPALLQDWLNALEAAGTPTVCVVVYGNRVYDNALLELKDIVTSRGCIPIACAAYVGEHSFSSSRFPVAPGRPDAEDLDHALAFGQRVRAKLESLSSLSQVSDVPVPGTRPYGGVTRLWDVDFIAVDDRCIHCGDCAKVCPMGAVDANDSAAIDPVKCITCCACIKCCSQGARSMKPGPVMEAAIRLNARCKAPKRPEVFL
jgi:ferredoxin